MTKYSWKDKMFNIEYEYYSSELKVVFNEWRPTDIIVQLPKNKYYSSDDLDLENNNYIKSKNRIELESSLMVELSMFWTRINRKNFLSDDDKYVVFCKIMPFKYIDGYVFLDDIKIGKSTTLKNAHLLVKKYLQKQLENYIDITQKDFAQQMGYDFNPTHEIVQYKTFWGRYFISKKHIQYSLQLVKQNKEFINSTIWHELTHITHRGHDAKFYNKLLRYCPRYKQIKADIKNICI